MADKPGFVGDVSVAGVHLSKATIAYRLEQLTRRSNDSNSLVAALAAVPSV